jgi:broad specificity phosphatase PhoE
VSDLTIHLVRHGQTADNAERRFQFPETPLSELGREQATAIANVLAASTRAEVLMASDYSRAIETAMIIGAILDLPVLPEPAIRERDFGSARGRLYEDIGVETLTSWRDPFIRAPDGESWVDVHQRIVRFFDSLRATPPGREIILVTHGGTMSIAIAYLEGRSIAEFALQPLENCAVRSAKLRSR